jgi:hypothetical protein
VLPTAGVVDHRFAQNAGRPVEVEEVAGARTSPVLQNEVAVEQHGLHFSVEAVIAVQVGPSGLNHADGGIGEEMDGALQEVSRGTEIGIENGHELSGCRLQTFLESARFEPVAVIPVMVFDGVAERFVLLYKSLREGSCIVRGIVQNLDLEQFLGVVDLHYLFNEALHHVPLVVERQLDGNRRELLEALGRLRNGLLPVLEIRPDYVVAMDAIDGEDHQDREIGDEHGPIEPRELVNACERIVKQAVHQAVRCGSCDQERQGEV